MDLGIILWDTQPTTANGQNKEQIAQVRVPNRKKIFMVTATKFGFRKEEGTGTSYSRKAIHVIIVAKFPKTKLGAHVLVFSVT